MASPIISPDDVVELATLMTLYGFLVAANDIAKVTSLRQVRNDLSALIERVDGHVTALGDRMGMSDR